jgi:6-phosphogluconate dehydrogenase
MVGGQPEPVRRLGPVFTTLAPGVQAAPTTEGRRSSSTAEEGYLHCGPSGAGHFVKMVHNGIEYALMGAYAEGFNILAHANVGARPRPADAETAPLRDPEHYQYDLPLPAAIETSAPAPILTAALFQRYSSRGENDLANRLLSAMRFQFGGHVERTDT